MGPGPEPPQVQRALWWCQVCARAWGHCRREPQIATWPRCLLLEPLQCQSEGLACLEAPRRTWGWLGSAGARGLGLGEERLSASPGSERRVVVYSRCWIQPELSLFPQTQHLQDLAPLTARFGLSLSHLPLGQHRSAHLTSAHLREAGADPRPGSFPGAHTPVLPPAPHPSVRSRSQEEGSERLWTGCLRAPGEPEGKCQEAGQVPAVTHRLFLLSPSRRWASRSATAAALLAATGSTCRLVRPERPLPRGGGAPEKVGPVPGRGTLPLREC